jgi:hypothetical protein
LIIRDDAHRDALPVYEVKELSLEEAMRIIARDKIPDNLCLPENYPAAASTPAINMLTA